MAIVNSRAAIEPKTGKAAIFVNETIHSLIRKLFANGEQGFFYDPNDLSTMYQDAAGTVPVTGAWQAVGLMLDKRKGLQRNLVKNTDFTKGIDRWSVSDTQVEPTHTMKITGQGLRVYLETATPVVSLTLVNALDVGEWFEIEIDCAEYTAGVLKVDATAGAVPVVSKLGLNKAIICAQSRTLSLYRLSAPVNLTIRSIVINKITGNHAYQTTSAARPILRDTPRRIDFDAVDDKLITNLPAQVTGCTVIRSVPNVGTQILTGQTIPATYEDNKDHCGLVVINRALTPSETSAITAEFNKRAGV